MAFEFAEQRKRSCKDVSGADVMYLFQPDTILPLQFSDMHRRNIYVQSEKRLMLAVLEDAVACFQKYHSTPHKKEKTLFREVEEWFRSKDDQWLFSFENICQTLAINPDYFRRGLLEREETRPMSPRSGPKKETKSSRQKTALPRGMEKDRVSIGDDDERDRVAPRHNKRDYLRGVNTGRNKQSGSVSITSVWHLDVKAYFYEYNS